MFKKLFFLLVPFLSFSQEVALTQHCGYDFTSYFVLDIHEEGKNENIKGLKVTLVDLDGNELTNTDNKYSWNATNKPLVFAFNYRIDDSNQRIETLEEGKKERWFFPYARDNYYVSVVNSFPADQAKVKIEDVDGKENGGFFETVFVELNYFDLFVLCSNQKQEYTVKFGRKANKPLQVVLKKQE